MAGKVLQTMGLQRLNYNSSPSPPPTALTAARAAFLPRLISLATTIALACSDVSVRFDFDPPCAPHR
jgi:hypothetical protein